MKRLLIFILVMPLLAFAKKANQTPLGIDKLVVRTGAKTTVVESEKVKARIFGLTLGAALEDKLDSNFSLFLDLDANFETGSNQATGNYAEYEPLEELNLNGGGVVYHPNKQIEVKLGALNQGVYESPLLLGGVTFAGVQEKVSVGNFYLRATQAIPSNNKLSRRIGGVEEKTPSFNYETLGFKSYTRQYKFKLEMSHFKFDGLSSDIALKSSEHGNSTQGINDSRSFNYNFEGFNLASKFRYLTKKGTQLLSAVQVLYNDKAPSGRNSGYLVKLGLGTKFALFTVTSFKNESDSSVAIYNSKLYQHNNTQGVGIGYEYKTKKFDIKASYYRSEVIEKSSLQSDTDTLVLELERFYEF